MSHWGTAMLHLYFGCYSKLTAVYSIKNQANIADSRATICAPETLFVANHVVVYILFDTKLVN
jgi:hypothetical protein